MMIKGLEKMETVKKKQDMPLSINIMKFERYNFNFLAFDEVLFFEYLVVKGIAFKYREFYHSAEQIYTDIGIKRTRQERIIDKFKKLGIIKVNLKGMPQVKHFEVNYVKILDLLENIYQIEELCKLSTYQYRVFIDFYKLHADNYKQFVGFCKLTDEN